MTQPILHVWAEREQQRRARNRMLAIILGGLVVLLVALLTGV